MADDKQVMSRISSDQGAKLLSQTQQQFPYLSDKNLSVIYTPNSSDKRMLEFYPPQEQGTPDQPRPPQLPLNQPGIQIFNPKTSPMDILADYISHYGVTSDPKLTQFYAQFVSSLNPQVMQQRYLWSVKNEGETRPFDEWLKMSGAPAYFRGYTFNQWPSEFNKTAYTPDQIKLLDTVRQYLGIK